MFIRCLVVVLVIAALMGGCAPRSSQSAEAVLGKPTTGFIAVEGGSVWYKVSGSGRGTPLLVLHGGPGIPHDYLENLDQLGDDRPIVFYDQLGCGRSERPDDPSLWTRERFAREVGQVREALGLSEVVLYGHSWGSILAIDYLAGVDGAGGSRPSGVRAVILAGPALSVPRWTVDTRHQLAAIGPDVSAAVLEGERTGRTDTEDYKRAMHLFYGRHVCRLDPWPEPLNRAMAGMGGAVYASMNGPSEFSVTGTLKTVDVTPRLPTLRQPILFICGEHDEATPESVAHYASFAQHATVMVIPGASHVANYDRPEAYLAALRRWLDQHGK